MNDIAMLGMGIKNVKQYPYRSAIVPCNYRVAEFPRNDNTRFFEEQMARMSGNRTDNHIVYEITMRDGTKIYISCSDLTIAIGTKILEQNW